MTFALLSVLGVFAAGLLPAAPTPSCAANLLNDWYDGALEGTYEPQCYRDALDAMPEDVRVYTTAVDDISRALRQRLEQDDAATAERGSARSLSGVRRPAGAQRAAEEAAPVAVGETPTARQLPAPVLVLVGLVLAVALATTGTMVSRRVRRTRAGPR